MSDCYPARIEIGGQVPQRRVKKLAAAINQESGMLGDFDGEVGFDAETELRKAVQEDQTFVLCDCEAHNGMFSDLEEFCEKNKIAFRRQSSAKYEFLPEVKIYLPGVIKGTRTTLADDDGEPMVSLSRLEAIQTKPAAGSFADLIAELRMYSTPLPPLVIR